ncbi:MAG: hypothetical protein HN816_02920 [Gammaproteobacteria bacterium]|jgi:hypothetical protein|nr:hypothetical protein [Gammaproteobacteria bacterium]
MNRFLTIFALIGLAGCQSAAPLQFALIGDNPYQEYNFPKYRRMINDINRTDGIAWVVHVGDMKDGTASCDDDNLKSILEINQAFRVPFVLTPGDNDWFDCSREAAGGYDRYERLVRLREIFYSDPVDLPLVRQSDSPDYPDYVENVYWVHGDVIFATVHIVGVTGQEGGIDIHNAVTEAAVAWVDSVFAKAESMNARGVFIATQADIYPITSEPYLLGLFCPKCPKVRPFYETVHEALLQQTRRYRKPVVLAVGDTHIFRVDKPLYDGEHLVEHFTRVETFGEGQVHWVRVMVDPASREVFSFHQEIIAENVGVGWSESDRE